MAKKTKHRMVPIDLEEIVGVCNKVSYDRNSVVVPGARGQRAKHWREIAWNAVVDCIGEIHAEEAFDKIEAYETAYFSIRPRHPVGSFVMHDAKTVTKDFRAAHPEAPENLVENFRVFYLKLHR